MKRLIGIDYGTKRIGLSQSDPLQIIVSPIGTINSPLSDEERITLILAKIPKDISFFVVGLPLSMNGKESSMTEKVRVFASKLESLSQITVKLWDERLSSKQVECLMKGNKVSRKKIKESIDTLSAVVILESYINAMNSLSEQE